MKFGLDAKIKDPDLFFELISELGTTFYRTPGKGIFEIVYFSGNRIIAFTGKLNKEHQKQLDIYGNKVEKLDIDIDNNVVRVEQ